MTGYAFPDMLVDVVKLSKAGQRDDAHDVFDAHLPLSATSSSRASGSPSASTCCSGAARSPPTRSASPPRALTAKARAEVDYLLARLARHDPRARP